MKNHLLKAIAIVSLLALPGISMAEDNGNHYGQKPSTDNWTYSTSYDSVTKVATLELTIDNLNSLLAYNGVVTKSWYNIQVGDEGAVIDSIDLGLDGDPMVNLNFSVTSGSSATTFNIVSTLLSFPIISNAKGVATSAVTVTDSFLTNDGATGTGLFGGKFYEARYNTSTIFADLSNGPVVTQPSSSATSSGSAPWQNIGSVSNMQSEFYFTLTANDLASGTSSYGIVANVVPEPGGMIAMLSGLVGLAGVIRRRKKV